MAFGRGREERLHLGILCAWVGAGFEKCGHYAAAAFLRSTELDVTPHVQSTAVERQAGYFRMPRSGIAK